MPKYKYNKHYGVLSMFPFGFSFLGFFTLPFLIFTENRKTLESINSFCFHIVYSMVLMITLPTFIIFNIVLAPFAYLKTVVHKFKLWRHYKAS